MLITLVLLKLLDHMFSLIISESSDQPDDKGQEYSTEDGSPQLIRDSVLWEPLSLACFCLSIDNSQVKVFKEYSKELPDVSKRISKVVLFDFRLPLSFNICFVKIVVDFCKILSRVANEAMYSYNVDAPQELVPEDAITLGLKQTAVHYKEYSAQKLKQFFENIYSTTERVFDIRISRVVHLAKFFSVSFPDILVFSEDSEYEKFTVFDDIKKVKTR